MPPPPGIFPARGHDVLPGIAVEFDGGQEIIPVDLGADPEAEEIGLKVLPSRDRFQEGGQVGYDDPRTAAEDVMEETHPLGNGVQGGWHLEIGVIEEGGERRDLDAAADLPGEEPAIGLERAEPAGQSADKNDRALRRSGQTGNKIGLGRFDDAPNR